MPETMVSGVIAYLRPDGSRRGDETFSIVREGDGTLVGRAYARTYDSRFARDAMVTLSPERDLVEAFVRLRIAEQFRGSGYFSYRDGVLRGVADMVNRGRVTQEIAIATPFTFVTHSVAFDALHFFHYDHDRGGQQRVPVYNTSTVWNGTDGPIGYVEEYLITSQSRDRITVPAGTFDCTRWLLQSGDPAKGELTIWVGDTYGTFIKLDWTLNLQFELVEYSERPLA